MKMTPTVKNCGSECPHSGTHDHIRSCDPVDENGVKCVCKKDPECRCVSAFREELYECIYNANMDFMSFETVQCTADAVISFLKGKGIELGEGE